MNKEFYIWIKWSLWGAIGIFAVSSGIYAVETSRILNDSHCGNSVLDPLDTILNWGSPIAIASSVGLICPACVGIGRKWLAMMGGIVVTVITVSLVSFWIWYHAVALDGQFELSNGVWWF